jgi:cardiolipin synthase
MAFDSILARETGRRLEPGHEVRRFRDDEIFDGLEDLISGAKKSLHLTIPLWKPSGPSERLLSALEAVRQSKVAARVVVDQSASGDAFDADVKPRLEEVGCEVRTGDIVRATAVADGQRAMAGQFRINDDHARDTCLWVEGPVVRFLQKAFLEDWKGAGGTLPPLGDLPWPKESGPVPAAWVNGDGMHILEFLFYEARHRVRLEAPRLGSDSPAMEALIAAASTGTDVRVVAAAPVPEVPRSLIERGGRVWEFDQAPMNARVALIDHAGCVVGTVHAGMLVVQGESLADTLAQDFEADAEGSREIALAALPRPVREVRKPLIRRMGSWVVRRVQRRRPA